MFKILTLFGLIAASSAQLRLVNLGGAGTGQLQGIRTIQGLQGLQGIQGIQGIQGLQGLNGLQGTGGQVVLLLSQPQTTTANIQTIPIRTAPAPVITTTTRVAPIATRVTIPQPRADTEDTDQGGPGMPYSFEYSTNDEQGTTTSRRESSDGNTVTGQYSYTDLDGLTRTVDYIADASGYRAKVSTNEPGVGRNDEIGDPADTEWNISEPPAGIQDRFVSARTAPVAPVRNIAIQPIIQPRPQVITVQAQPAPQPVTVVQQTPREQFVLVPASALSAGQLGQFGGLGNIRLASSASNANPGNLILLNALRKKK